MNYTAKEIGEILELPDLNGLMDSTICEVSIDSRTLISPIHVLFFALPGEMNDGHNFIDAAYKSGVRNFVVTQANLKHKYPDAIFFEVKDVLSALQSIATHHQKSFPYLEKVGITGSNGKTIIKEWLYQMLYDEFNIVKSPKSYNSQIGMALSLLAIERDHELGIFEAGISRSGEMKNHLQMLNPDIGLITNIGSAHDQGFSTREEKLAEKMILFKNVKAIIYKKENGLIDNYVTAHFQGKEKFTWGNSGDCNIQILDNRVDNASRLISIKFKDQFIEVKLRFSDNASFENCMHCIAIMCYLELSLDNIKHRMHRISGLHMRMEMTTGKDQSILINDAYSADLDALHMALEFVQQQADNREKVAILGAFDQSGKEEQFVFNRIIEQLTNFGFKELIYISNHKFDTARSIINVHFYKTKEEFLENIQNLTIRQKVILIKGARHFGLEDVSDRLSDNGHSATLQINLNALEHNLRVYKKYLEEDVGIIAVVKASAYGTGSSEVAQLLERNGVNCLAVAFADEGIALRQSGIKSDIMVFNPDLSSLQDITRYRLEPEVYDLRQLEQIIHFSNQNKEVINIHLKLDTGMHRLGFLMDNMEELNSLWTLSSYIKVKTIFSHLASSEDACDDDYSQGQFDLFDKMYARICTSLKYTPKRHILNSGGISRFANRQYDFVRLGIGMYGIDNNSKIQPFLRKVHRLNASLIQVKKMKKGDSIGYNRKTTLEADTTIGIVNIGYADGVMRNLGNKKYSFNILGKEALILGNVCMDVTIVDLSNVHEARVGENVVVFDNTKPIEHMALAAETIPYEIISRISTRVKRKFVRE